MIDPQSNGDLGSMLPLFLASTMLFEASMFTATMTGQLDPHVYGLAHVGGLIAGCVGVWWLPKHAKAKPLAAVGVILTFVAGPFGSFCSLALLWPSHRLLPIAGPAGDDPRHHHYETVMADLLAHRLQIRTLSPRPLIDIFLVGSDDQQLTALGRMLKRFEPAMAATLRLALQSTEPSVRVLAATVIAKLHLDFSERIAALQVTAEMATAPGEAWNELAAACWAYAKSGLLDSTQCNELKARAGAAQVTALTVKSTIGG